MDAETKALLLKYLEVGADRLERGAAFVEAEIPLVVQEYLSWYWWGNLLAVILFSVCFLFSGLLAKSTIYCAKELDKVNGYADSGWVPGVVFSFLGTVIFGIIGLIGTGIHVTRVVKVSVAPRVVILEKIAEVAK